MFNRLNFVIVAIGFTKFLLQKLQLTLHKTGIRITSFLSRTDTSFKDRHKYITVSRNAL